MAHIDEKFECHRCGMEMAPVPECANCGCIHPQLDKEERGALVERVEELLDNTEDWQLDMEEYADAIIFWTTIMEKLGFRALAEATRKEHLGPVDDPFGTD